MAPEPCRPVIGGPASRPEPRGLSATECAGEPIGLLAGWGRFPFEVAEALRRQGARVVCVGVKDHADRALAERCDVYRELGLGRLGGAIRFLRRQGVRRATMAGKIHKTLMYRPWIWLRHLPDWTCLRTIYPHWIARTRDCKDDSLLGAVVDAYARGGIEFAPATDFAPELLVRSGTLGRRPLTRSESKDIEFGWQLAKEMGRLDVGQSVAVKDQAVLAVEAIEGTDACIRRAGELCGRRGFTLVKVAKPQQDMRFDVPTVGVGTLESLVKAGGKVLAIEAGRTIVIDESAVIAFADRHGISLVALEDEAAVLREAA